MSEPAKNNFKVLMRGQAQKNLLKIPKPWQVRIIEAVDGLVTDPFTGEKLWGEMRGKYKIRVWPYRIIYEVLPKEKLVYVLRIDHRQGVYK